jgi:hypothetical protein
MTKIQKLKIGDKVVMHTCGEAEFPKYFGKVWTCKTDEYTTGEGLYEQNLVFLEGFSGSFATEFLQLVDLSPQQVLIEQQADAIESLYQLIQRGELTSWDLKEADRVLSQLKGESNE